MNDCVVCGFTDADGACEFCASVETAGPDFQLTGGSVE
jgi:hypothetical protein